MDHPSSNDTRAKFAIFLQSLNTLSPSDILSDDAACTCFQEFFARGTAQACWELLPAIHKPYIASASESKPERNPRSPNSDDAIVQHFQSIIGNNPTRINRLVRVVKAWKGAAQLPDDAVEKLWQGKDGIFAERDPVIQRILYNGRRKTCQGSCEYSLIDRFTLLFVGAEVDWSQDGEPGKRRATIGFNRVAEQAGIDVNIVKDDAKRSKHYFELLKLAGPGSIISLGRDATNWWEKEMTFDDIRLVVQYRNAHLNDIAEQARKQDIVASRAIIRGLIGYGRKKDDILHANAPPLVNQIALYLQKHGRSLRETCDEIDGEFSKQIKRNSDSRKRKRTFAGDDRHATSSHQDHQADLGYPIDQWMAESLSAANTLPQLLPHDPVMVTANTLDHCLPEEDPYIPSTDPFMVASLSSASTLDQADPCMMTYLSMAESLQNIFPSALNYSQQGTEFPQQSFLDGAELSQYPRQNSDYSHVPVESYYNLEQPTVLAK